MSGSDLPRTTDIVVAGGGPAGATIARLLTGFGFRVVLFEKRRFPRPQIGESLTPNILPLLDFLNLRASIEAAGFLRMAGHTVCWGSAQPRTSYYSSDHSRRGFQVWRADFDHLLLEHARRSGVQVVEEHAVESVHLQGGAGVAVRYAPQGQIEAAFFIDASGHAGVLARQGLRQRDRLMQTLALTAYWQGATAPAGIDAANTLVEAYADGMVWSVPLHNGLRNVTLLVDWQEGARIRHVGLRALYLSELQRISYISGFLKGARLAQAPAAFDASLYTASAFADTSFLLVGDAGLFIDPLSSEGVHKAMASAITGAVVVNTILRRPTMAGSAIGFYAEGQQTTYESHYRQSVQYYREEKRWPGHPFWQKRSQAPENLAQVKHSSFTSHSAIPHSYRVSYLRLAPEVTFTQRAVIEGAYVEMRDVVVTPHHPRGVRFLQGVNVPVLLKIVAKQGAVADIIATYLRCPEGTRCPPESVRQVLARLYQEGVLTASEPSDSP